MKIRHNKIIFLHELTKLRERPLKPTQVPLHGANIPKKIEEIVLHRSFAPRLDSGQLSDIY